MSTNSNSEIILPRVKLTNQNNNATLHIDGPKPFSNNSISEMVHHLHRAFDTGRTKNLKFRKQQLKALIKCLEDNESAITDAIYKDLRKHHQEAFVFEILPTINEIKHLLQHLDEYATPTKCPKGLINMMDGIYIYKDPYGVVLILGAWNYPLQLTLLPLAGAIAGGNCVLLKPSELAPQAAQVIHEILPKYIDKECYKTYLGGIRETTDILRERFDYIFYTGGTQVGKIIHKAANKHLTPTTLELGGKSPAYIDNTANMEIAVRRILWGKCVNSGQTCIAPDYILCTKEVQDKFIKFAEKIIREFYGNDVKQSDCFGRIINDKHYERLANLLENVKIAIGGQTDPKERFIEPTIVVDVSPKDPIMKEEIFGPILPIVIIKNINEAIDLINEREKALAIYIFSTDKHDINMMLTSTSSGGVTVNDTLMHCSIDTLPFGGVGSSGMGAYHGKASFDTFTHQKSVLIKNYMGIMEKAQSIRYPPYSEAKTKAITRLFAYRKGCSLKFLRYLFAFFLGSIITFFSYHFYTNCL